MTKKHMIKKQAGIAVFIIPVLLSFILFLPVTAEAEYLSDHFSVWCNDPHVSNPLSVALVYSHEDGKYFDGILFFTPLKDFLEWYYDVPTVTVNGNPVYRVLYDSSYFDKFSESVSFYEPTEDDFVLIKKENGDPVILEELEPGDYLMAIIIHATKDTEYFSGTSFIHIIVPGSDNSVWPIPTATPLPFPFRQDKF